MSGTESYYYNSYNADSGVIASWMIYSPEYFMQTWHNAGNHPELPEIRRWSDVAWIEWVHQCGGETNKIRNIKAFILHDINSRYWKDMVKSKHFNRRRQEWAFPTWDQSQPISIASDLGSELLASPLGRGVCWFLISNKAVLGRKQVSLIRVFRGEHTAASTNTASMLLYVDDADNVSTEPQYTDGKGCCDIM